jgi:hypothetical protein
MCIIYAYVLYYSMTKDIFISDGAVADLISVYPQGLLTFSVRQIAFRRMLS